MQNILDANELKINSNDNICEAIHKKCHKKGYHSDIEYYMTLITIFIAINN